SYRCTAGRSTPPYRPPEHRQAARTPASPQASPAAPTPGSTTGSAVRTPRPARHLPAVHRAPPSTPVPPHAHRRASITVHTPRPAPRRSPERQEFPSEVTNVPANEGGSSLPSKSRLLTTYEPVWTKRLRCGSSTERNCHGRRR